MEKIWLESYPEGIPAEIDPGAHRSLIEMFEQACSRFAERPAFANMGHAISFKELDERSRDFAAYLQTDLKLARGERVALMMPNLLQYPVALFGLMRAGLVAVNVNPLYTSHEIEHQVSDADANTIIVAANFARELSEALEHIRIDNVIVTEIGDMLPFPKSLLINFVVKYVKRMVPAYDIPGVVKFNTALSRGVGLPFNRVDIAPDDIAFLQYTGGTTGVAKGAVLTHRNMIANVLQIGAWLGANIDEGEEIVITALPLYHVFCLTANCLNYLWHGGLNVLITNPRDFPRFIADMGKWKFTALTGVNTLFNALANDERFAALDFSSLKLCVGGGMAVQRATAEKWHRITGCHILEGYGLTESSPVVCVNPITLTEYSGTIGMPVPSTVVSLRDDDGNEVAMGERGELWVRGPQVMREYWNRPKETAKTLRDDGWLLTGDIAVIDKRGYVKIVDRKKDMILVSGFNVYPNEVEDVVAMHPAVLEVACVGVPHERSGEAVKVFVVLKPGVVLSVEELRDFCKEHLTGYKVPKLVEFRDELPKSNVGKILRRALRDEAVAQQ